MSHHHDSFTGLRCGETCHGYIGVNGRCDACGCAHIIGFCRECEFHAYDRDMATDDTCADCMKQITWNGTYRNPHNLSCIDPYCDGCVTEAAE